MSALSETVVQTAINYIGKRELPNNSGFIDKDFQKKMEAMGWSKGFSWCSFFAELCIKLAIGKDHPSYTDIDKLFSGSAVATYANFKASKKFKVGSVPKPGAVAIWRLGDGWQGHAAIVTKVIPGTNKFKTVEGNTNSLGGREGIEVAEKTRLTGEKFKAKGLNLLGFIYPPES